MNNLLSIRANILYSKVKEKDEYIKHWELIFLSDKPTYTKTNEDEIIRSRGIEELRFTISDDAFPKFIELLQKIKDSKDQDWT